MRKQPRERAGPGIASTQRTWRWRGLRGLHRPRRLLLHPSSHANQKNLFLSSFKILAEVCAKILSLCFRFLTLGAMMSRQLYPKIPPKTQLRCNELTGADYNEGHGNKCNSLYLGLIYQMFRPIVDTRSMLGPQFRNKGRPASRSSCAVNCLPHRSRAPCTSLGNSQPDPCVAMKYF